MSNKNKDNKNFKDRAFIPYPIPNSERELNKIKGILSNQPIMKKEDQLEISLELPQDISNNVERIHKQDQRMKEIRQILSNTPKEEDIELPIRNKNTEINLVSHDERMKKIRGLLKK